MEIGKREPGAFAVFGRKSVSVKREVNVKTEKQRALGFLRVNEDREIDCEECSRQHRVAPRVSGMDVGGQWCRESGGETV